jgi:intein/homing endonuclease
VNTSLRYPKKSHRKKILCPDESEMLAEFLGIVFGDGGMNGWQLTVTLSISSDSEYIHYVQVLGRKLFNIDPHLIRREQYGAGVIVFSSTDLVEFLVGKGAVVGNKVKQLIGVPRWIIRDTTYTRAFIRGLFDTDGCFYIDHHTINRKVYRNPGISIRSYSPPLIGGLNNLLISLGYHPTISTENAVVLRRRKEVLSFFNDIGSSNPRKYAKLKKFMEEYQSGHNGTASKAVVRVTEPWVRIPPPPPIQKGLLS